MLPLAVVTAAVMLVAWFPLSTYLHQADQLNATAAQINAIQLQERALQLQTQSIATKSSATLLARQDYQLVLPGQSLIQVLPGHQSGKVTQASGDPGLQPLVSPSSVSTLVVNPTATNQPHRSASSYLSRLVRTLEFWR